MESKAKKLRKISFKKIREVYPEALTVFVCGIANGIKEGDEDAGEPDALTGDFYGFAMLPDSSGGAVMSAKIAAPVAFLQLSQVEEIAKTGEGGASVEFIARSTIPEDRSGKPIVNWVLDPKRVDNADKFAALIVNEAPATKTKKK